MTVNDTPIENIIEFRKKHNNERKRFMDAISGLVKDLQDKNVPTDALKQKLQEQYSAVEKGYDDYKAALKGTKIKPGTTLLGMSFPARLGHFGTLLTKTLDAPNGRYNDFAR